MPFIPPSASAQQLQGIDFSTATDFAAAAKQRFDAKDREPGNRDPSLCKALLKFPGTGGAVFWSSKMAIDTDGPSAGLGRPSGKQLDANPGDASNQTSFKPFGGDGLASEIIPYVVLPQLAHGSAQMFDPAVAIGDVAIVIFKGKKTAAVCGDAGPFNKIGEASIAVHMALSDGHACPDPCTRRDASGNCLKARDSSVEQDVLFFVFPNSAFDDGELTADNINAKVTERAEGLFSALRGPPPTS
ncbi:MAG TPA: glycoside hydrolase family 75 protein [Pseudolabrys sp.]|nr:glycoside hydrolase family 75 protein [Pseudolabrys sp.]